MNEKTSVGLFIAFITAVSLSAALIDTGRIPLFHSAKSKQTHQHQGRAASEQKPPKSPLGHEPIPSSLAKGATTDYIEGDASAEHRQSEKNMRDIAVPVVQAIAAIVAAVATVVLAKFASGQYRVYRSQLRIMHRQARIYDNQHKIMQGQLALAEAERRPWIAPKIKVASDLVIENGNLSITFDVTLKNTGGSPAFKVFSYIRMYPHTRETADQTVLQKRVADEAMRWRDRLGFAIFPGDEVVWTPTRRIPADELTKAIESWGIPEIAQTGTSFWLVGCITYKASLSTAPYQTGFIYQLGRRDPKYPGASVSIAIMENLTILQDDVVLRPSPVGDVTTN